MRSELQTFNGDLGCKQKAAKLWLKKRVGDGHARWTRSKRQRIVARANSNLPEWVATSKHTMALEQVDKDK